MNTQLFQPIRPLLIIALSFITFTLAAFEYPYQTVEPQKSGWPPSEEERSYVLKPEHERRPGSESGKHLPELWPQVPSAGYWGGSSWLDTHARLVEYVKSKSGSCDVLLVGDSITQQWGGPPFATDFKEPWRKLFSGLRAINIGIGGDKTQNVLWRLEHGGVTGLKPRAVILMIGNNNMFFTRETGIEAAAKGIQKCAALLRHIFPDSQLILLKILPAHGPGNSFYEDIKKTNFALDTLKPNLDPKVHILDLWADFTNTDGTLKQSLFTPDNIHLSNIGYGVFAEKLKPTIDQIFGEDPQNK
jgi:beta-glucosidase